MSEQLPVARCWFSVEATAPGLFRITEPHLARLWRANVFVVKGRERDLLVDSGMGVGDIRAALAPMLDKPLILFTTHNHLDHIGGHRQFTDAEILIHRAEADGLRAPAGPRGLRYDDFDSATRSSFEEAGFAADGLFIDAVPEAGYDPAGHRFEGTRPTRLVDEGEVIDVGDRRFTVLHLPGHSPGSIALWDDVDGVLIAGDTIYDGVLVDTMPCSDVASYLATMERLRSLPVQVVHGGHRASFGRARMLEIIDDYLATRRDGVRREPMVAPPIRF
jgi:glyoxylase-like metal-dependent hydrolase (beta-lactamase superfamily II)